MTNEELKALALSIREGCGLEGHEAQEAMYAFECAATPDAVLGLIADIERQHDEKLAWQESETAVRAERDTLKAECEGLRKDAERYRWLKPNAVVMLRLTPSYVATNGQLVHTCYPSQAELDASIDAAMSKEASNG